MDTRTITACLVSNSPANGFVDVIIREPFDRQNLLIRSKKFFHVDANIKECRITLSHTEEQNNHFQLMILYDHELHGKHNCPYLAYKFIDKSNVDDLGREDYMVVMKAIDISLIIRMKRKIRPTDQVVQDETKEDNETQ
ncbi:hypothetical protein DEU56DRAFT_757245 [Suillus clintonianus]|uniref:uncharacterized protein n=1 Tax=Suillus clintonianus TaxID=1904413 RepID=UPI001B863329|nr:uncharacterized protein DEU56DRAFT_757245 [Suillus clintonianus]KAG2133026.1 hypothetical protein DEU56DRAFT_757245 [Suillus clintonianus]